MTDLIAAPDAGIPATGFYIPITNADGSAGWEKVSISNLRRAVIPSFRPPLASDFTLYSGEVTNGTLSDDADVGLIFDYGTVNGSSKWRGAYKALPAGDWEVICKSSYSVPVQNFIGGGLFAINSANGAYVQLGPTISNGTPANITERRDSITGTYRSNVDESVGNTQQNFWLRLKWDNTAQTLSGWYSHDGKTWCPYIVSETLATMGTGAKPDRIGIGFWTSYNNVNRKILMSVAYWWQSW